MNTAYRVHSIPVAFSVQSPTEERAAYALVDLPASVHLTDILDTPVEDWSLPNHEYADRSDHEGWRLAWIDPVRKAYRINFWIEATDYTYTAMLTLDEAEWVTGWLDSNDDVTDLHIWIPDEPLDGPLALREAVLDGVGYWPGEKDDDEEDDDAPE